jgi:hypothetical protein
MELMEFCRNKCHTVLWDVGESWRRKSGDLKTGVRASFAEHAGAEGVSRWQCLRLAGNRKAGQSQLVEFCADPSACHSVVRSACLGAAGASCEQ